MDKYSIEETFITLTNRYLGVLGRDKNRVDKDHFFAQYQMAIDTLDGYSGGVVLTPKDKENRTLITPNVNGNSEHFALVCQLCAAEAVLHCGLGQSLFDLAQGVLESFPSVIKRIRTKCSSVRGQGFGEAVVNEFEWYTKHTISPISGGFINDGASIDCLRKRMACAVILLVWSSLESDYRRAREMDNMGGVQDVISKFEELYSYGKGEEE